jgi:hypothetical protein
MPTDEDEIRALTEKHVGKFNAAELKSIFSTLTVDQFSQGRVLHWDEYYRRNTFEIRKKCTEQTTGQKPYCGTMRISPVVQSATLLIDNRDNQKFLSVIYHFSYEHRYSFRAHINTDWPWKEKYHVCLTYSPLPVSMSAYIEKHHGKGKVEVTMKDVHEILDKFMRCKSRVEVSFDYIEFLQCSMEWGDRLHFIAWKRLCEVEEGRSMTKEEILNTPQALDWGHRPYLDADGKRALRPRDLQKKELLITSPGGFVHAFLTFDGHNVQYLGVSDGLEYKHDEGFKGKYDYTERKSNNQWFRGRFCNAYNVNNTLVCTVDELMASKIQIKGHKWNCGSRCYVGDFIKGGTNTFSIGKRAGNEFDLDIVHSLSLRHGTTDWIWEEEFRIGITVGPLTRDVVDELEKRYGGSSRWTNHINPRISRAEEKLKTLLTENNSMDLYEGPPNNDLSYESPNQRRARRSRIKIKMNDKIGESGNERLPKKRMMEDVKTDNFDYNILRQKGVKVKFDYIIFRQSSMEWGDPLHFIAWKSICQDREGRNMTDEEIVNTPQAIQWERNSPIATDGSGSPTYSSVEHIKASMIQAVWRSFRTRISKMPGA